jgi:dienelactone hydrolase
VADGMAAQCWLADREGVNTDDIVLMGRSIGGGVSVAAAAEQGARALVLEATFSRMTDAAANLYPWLPVRLVMSNRYNSIKRMQKFSGPLFQSHGAADEVVPIKLARKLFDSSPGDDKQFYEIAYARHNDTPPTAYYAALNTFLDRVDQQHEEALPASIRRRNRRLISRNA